MSILDHIDATASTMSAIGQAVSAVRLAVPLGRGQPAILSLVPTMSSCGVGPAADGISLRACERADDWRIAFPAAPPEDLDADFLSAAWSLGAWDVSRIEHAHLQPGVDPMEPQFGIAHHVHQPYRVSVDGKSSDPMPCPVDAYKWARQAARKGWLVWLCKPILHGPSIRAGWIAKDRTLRPDGGRDPRPDPWRPWRPVVRHADYQAIIRLGRAAHGNRSNVWIQDQYAAWRACDNG